MDRLKEIFYMLEEQESKEEVAEDGRRIEELEKKAKISIDDELTFAPFENYLRYRELKCFKKGFAYAMQLMKECDRL